MNPAIIVMSGTGAANNLSASEGTLLTANSAAIASFVNSGGGLMAHGSGTTAFGWLTALIPGATFPSGCTSSTLSLTPAGQAAFPGLTNAHIRAGPCHNHFTNHGLTVLARDGTTTFRDIIIGGSGVVLPGQISLSPGVDFNPPGTSHTVTARVTNTTGTPLAAIVVTFSITSGPNSPRTATGTTNSSGDATFTYTSNGNIGLDRIQASFVDPATSQTILTSARKYWDVDCQGDGSPDACDLSCATYSAACAADFTSTCGTAANTNGDQIPDACDADLDGVTNTGDNCPNDPNPSQADLDNDGIGDVCDPDRDGDGIANAPDNCPDVPNTPQTDTDGDNVGNACDDDDDGDGVADVADQFPCDATASGQIFAPGEGIHGVLQFEDFWPVNLDLDFNDVVVTYNYVFQTRADGAVTRIKATFNVLAAGGIVNHGFGLHWPLAGQSALLTMTIGNGMPVPIMDSLTDAEMTFVVSNDLRADFFPGTMSGQVVNARPSDPVIQSVPFVIDAVLAAPVSMSTGLAPFDPFIFRRNNRGHEVHLPDYCGTSMMDQSLFGTGIDGSTPPTRCYVDNTGLPSGLVMPQLVDYPKEGVDIHLLYPRISSFAASGGTQDQDFYTTPVSQHAYPTPLSPAFPAGTDFPADNMCLDAP